MAQIKQDIGALTDQLESGLKDVLNGLLDGSIESLDGPVRQSSVWLAEAAKRGDWALVEEARDHLAISAIEEGIAAREGLAGMLQPLLGMGINALVNGAIAGIGSLKAV